MLLILFFNIIVQAYYPTINEYTIIDMIDIFGPLNNATYSGTNQQCTIIQPLNKIKYSEHTQTSEITYFKCSQDFCVSLDNKNILHWTQDTLVSETPQFIYNKQIQGNCYDFDFIDDFTVIVDCIDEKLYNNFHYVQLPQNTLQSKLFDKNSISSFIYRKLNVMNSDYILLGQKNTTYSIIDIYSIEEFRNLNESIDSTLLSKLASLKQFKFKLMDFIVRFGLVYILDETNLFVLYYQNEWKLNAHLILPTKAIAFDANIISDLNGNEEFELLILTLNGNLLHYEDFTHQPTFIAIIGQQIAISNKFAVVQDNQQLILIDIHNNIIVSGQQWQQQKFYVNPLNSILLAVTQTQTQKYLLSYGQLICNSSITTTEQSITITAKYGQQQTESVQFNYQYINPNDQTLYQIGDPILFENAIVISPYTEYLTPFVSGPNIQYIATNQSEIVKIAFINQFYEESLVLPIHSIFQDTLTIGISESLMIFQTKDFILQLWGCNTFVPKDQCGYLGISFEVDVQLTKLNFNWWQYEGDVFIAIVTEQKEVQIWELTLQELKKTQKIRTKYPILQVLGQKNTLYILLSSGNVEVYENGQLTNSIEPAEPALKLFNNPYYSSEILIIQTKTTFIITRYHDDVQVIEYFSNSYDDLYVAIFHNSFIIVTQQKIQEYSLSADSSQFLKTLPLYDYQISNQIAQSKHNGLLFILASKSQLNYILVYKPLQFAHDSLYQVIELSALTSLKNIILSADGYHTTEVFYQDSAIRQHFVVLESTEIISVISSTSDSYCYQAEEQIKVFNSQTQLPFKTQLKVVNTMEHIQIVEQNYNEILLEQSNNVQYISLGNNWYRGQAVNFRVSCKQCPDEVNIYEPVHLQGVNLYQDIKLVAKFDSTNQILVTSTQFIVADSYLKQMSSFYLGQEAYRIAINNNIILLAIQKEKSTSLIMIQCKTPYSCQFISEKNTNYLHIDQMELNSHRFLFISSGGKLYINFITYDDTKWSYELKSTINIQDYQPCLGINYFTVQSIYTNTFPDYIVSILDQNGNILFFFFKLQSEDLKIITSTVKQLHLIIDDLKQYSQEDTQFIKLISLKSFEKTLSGYLYMKFLVITDNVASYALNFVFNHMDYGYYDTVLVYIVNQYGDWKATQSSYMDWGRLCMHYTNGVKNVILYYFAPSPDIQFPYTLTSIDGLSESQKNEHVLVYIYSNNDGLFLLTNINNKQSVSSYKLDIAPVFAVSNQVNLDLSQIVSVIVSNDFSSTYKQFTLRQIVEPIKESSSAGWIITVTVLTGVVLIVMLIYVLRRRSIRQNYQNYQPMVDQQLRNL